MADPHYPVLPQLLPIDRIPDGLEDLRSALQFVLNDLYFNDFNDQT